MGVLIAAEEWGCPPWEIAGGDKLKWYFRWQEYAKHRAKKQRIDAGEAIPEDD
jgi:hypothetical protein